MLNVLHPSPILLTNESVKKLKMSELDLATLRSGGVVRPPTKRYEELAGRKEVLMRSYANKEVGMKSFLTQMGHMSLRHAREANRLSVEVSKPAAPSSNTKRKGREVLVPTSANDSVADTMSETRPMSPRSEDSDGDPDPFPRPVAKRPRIAPIMEARRKGAKCVNCVKGFVWSKNTWVKCEASCENYFHKKCLSEDRFRDPFKCYSCVPDTVLDPDLGKKSIFLYIYFNTKTLCFCHSLLFFFFSSSSPVCQRAAPDRGWGPGDHGARGCPPQL